MGIRKMADQEKRTKILNAAEQVMSLKGLNNSSISEIVEIAKVPDSAIYQYFKGKEDLLFSVDNLQRRIDYLATKRNWLKDQLIDEGYDGYAIFRGLSGIRTNIFLSQEVFFYQRYLPSIRDNSINIIKEF